MSEPRQESNIGESQDPDNPGMRITMCWHCRHFAPGDYPPSCGAFPDAIPADILEMRHDHRRPYPGDGGVLFQPDDSAPGYLREPL